MKNLFQECWTRLAASYRGGRGREAPLIVLILCAGLSVGAQMTLSHHRPFRQEAMPQRANPDRNESNYRPALPVPEYFRRWREKFRSSNEPHDEYGLVRGIFLGDSSSIPRAVTATFQEAGLTHLLAASGFNCWIVAAAFGWIARVALTAGAPFMPSWPWLVLKSGATPFASLLGAVLFWLWTDQSAPITRSVVMIALKIMFERARWRVPFERMLLVQYLVSLALLPRLWRSPSFQLSFGCLFGLVYVPRLASPHEPKNPILKSLWGYFWTCVGASLGALPATCLFFGEVNFTSLLTNWFAIPPVSFGIMPLALAQMLLLPWEHAHGGVHAITELLGIASAALAKGLYWVLVRWLGFVPSLRWYLD